MKHFTPSPPIVERFSQRILYILVGLSVLLFALFYLIGYDFPFSDNPDFNAPLLTDVLLILIYLFILFGLGVGIWAVGREVRSRHSQSKIVNGIPAYRISRSVVVGLLIVLTITFIFGSTQPMIINGKPFNNTFLLRLADQLINTGIVLLIVALGVMLFGLTRYYRKTTHDVHTPKKT